MSRICDSVYLVGGPELTDPEDCLVYALDLGELVLVDCGLGPGWDRLRDRLVGHGLDPDRLHTLVLTHCHVDHVGAAARIREETGCRVVAHELDAAAIVQGDPTRTAAGWYGVPLCPAPVDLCVQGAGQSLHFQRGVLELLHTPGHTPGSLSAVLERDGERILFGQDIHGPFNDSFGSDIAQWRASVHRLIGLHADVLCEGHFGIERGAEAVEGFLRHQLCAQAIH